MPSEEETIIIGGGKQQARTSVVPQGVECPKVMAKKYTTYIWGFVAALPELYTSVLTLGPVPDSMRHILWGTAAFGLACSWIKQRIDQA